MSTRAQVLNTLARLIPLPSGHPLRVAVDGMTGVGKTSMRGELANALRALGRTVVEASGDDFHHQREHRYAQGKGSPRGYYKGAYDYYAMASKLLAPLGDQGDAHVRLRHHDLVTDQILDREPMVNVGADSTVVVDGSFLMRPEVADLWDFVVLVESPREVSVARQAVRDGAPTDADDPYHRRYLGAYDLYVARCDPRSRAHVLVDNADIQHPVLHPMH